jgi:CHAT domain-containing protein/tetratricopeptide (TPR) repeat protein
MLAHWEKALPAAIIFLAAACTVREAPITPATPVSLSDVELDRLADSLYRAGSELRMKGLRDSALTAHQHALSLRLEGGETDLRLAYSYWRTGHLLSLLLRPEAEETLSRAISLGEQLDAPVDSLARMYLHLAEWKAEMKDYTSAASLTSYAERLAMDAETAREELILACTMAKATVFNKSGRLQEALVLFQNAVSMSIRLGKSANLSQLYFNIALTQWSLNQNDEAMRSLDKALPFTIQRFGLISSPVASIYLNKGGIFFRSGQLDSARFYVLRCLAIRRRVHGDKHFQTAGANESMAEIYQKMGLLDSALFYRQAQLRSLIRDFNDINISKNPNPRQEEISLDLVDYLNGKGSTLKSIYVADSSRVDILELSLKTYLLADSVYTSFQSTLAYDDLKLNLLQAAPIPYTEMIDQAFNLFRITGNRDFVQLAHNVMEHSRAVVLKGALGRVDSFEKLGLPSEMLVSEKRLLQRRSDLLHLISDASTGRQVRDSLSDAVIQVNREYDQLKISIAKDQPNYLLLRFGTDISLDRLSSIMAQKQALWLEYYWSNEFVYVLEVGSSQVSLHRIPVTEQLLTNLESIGREILQFGEASFTKEVLKSYVQQARAVYDQLVGSVIKNHTEKRLIISPSGPLMSFPFETLLVSEPNLDEVDFRLNYLINHFDISYQYSSFFLDRERDRHGVKLLAMGHAATDSTLDTPGDLPGARREIGALQAIMTNGENRYLLQDQASELEFKANAEQFNLLHLAVHGVADSTDAMNSHLVFRNGGGNAEDGKLFARELYTLDLRQTDLAVLSACESGLGRVRAGEGIMSIARGFAYAGCPSMIVSLWKVSDKTSPVIMADFYRALSSGEQIDVALASAKRSYLRKTDMFNAHPSKWAAFLAIGETTAITQSTGVWASYFILSAIPILLLLWWLYRMIRASRMRLRPQHA